MPAQLIVVSTAAAEKRAAKTKKAAKRDKPGSKASADQPGPENEYPPFIPAPVGFLKVYGQKPQRIGHYADMTTLLEKVHKSKLPGGSNTLFASVGSISDLQSSSVRSKLENLPEQLTIIVHEGNQDA